MEVSFGPLLLNAARMRRAGIAFTEAPARPGGFVLEGAMPGAATVVHGPEGR